MDILAEWLLFPVISRLAFLSNLFMVFLADRGASSLCQGLPRRMKYASAKKRWFMPNVAKIKIKRRTARQALLFGVNSIYRLMWEWVVEASCTTSFTRRFLYGLPRGLEVRNANHRLSPYDFFAFFWNLSLVRIFALRSPSSATCTSMNHKYISLSCLWD